MVNVKYDGPPQEQTCKRCGKIVRWDLGDVAWSGPNGLICVAGPDPDGADDVGHYVTADKVLEVEAVAEVTYEDDYSAAVAEVSTEFIGPFARIAEWNADHRKHELVPSLEGKRVRVTVEVLS